MLKDFKRDCQDSFDALDFVDIPEVEKCPHTDAPFSALAEANAAIRQCP
ncbi:hypothetical protein [Trichloromonas sp.]